MKPHDYKGWCSAMHHRADHGPMKEFCPECYATWDRLFRLYHEILGKHPHLRSRPIDEVFALLWKRVKSEQKKELRRR